MARGHRPRAMQARRRTDAWWRLAQGVALAATGLLIVGLLIAPRVALTTLWNVAIPLVPAILLVSPALWRNVCPLATLNMIPNGLMGRRGLSSQLLARAGGAGVVLLLVLVPARRFLFNSDGTALAGTIVLVAIAALALGARFDAKAGFCNAICPVLPVERLYGQRPLLQVGNPRCRVCTLCTPSGCIDLAPAKSVAHTLGAARGSHSWLLTGFGAFTAAFPGFVIGYYTLQDGGLTAAGVVYLHIAAWALGSYLLTAVLVRLLNLRSSQVTPVLAAAAAGLYYWFAPPLLAEALGIPAAAIPLRIVFLSLVGVWLWRAGRNSETTRLT